MSTSGVPCCRGPSAAPRASPPEGGDAVRSAGARHAVPVATELQMRCNGVDERLYFASAPPREGDRMKRRTVLASLLALPFAAGSAAAQTGAAEQRAVLRTYCDIAQAMYSDNLAGAERLKAAVHAFLAAPSLAG